MVKKFLPVTFNDEIKPVKYFLQRTNGISLYCQVVIAMKIKPGKNLTQNNLPLKNSCSMVSCIWLSSQIYKNIDCLYLTTYT